MKANKELKELIDMLYYESKNGIRKVKQLPLLEKILIFERIKILNRNES